MILALMIIIFAGFRAKADVTVVRDAEGVIPIGDLAENNLSLVCIGDPHGNVFADYCRRYTTLKEDAGQGSRRIIAVYSSGADAVSRFKAAYRDGASIAVFFIPDTEIARFASVCDINEIVAAGGYSASSQKLAAEVIFGGKAAIGRLSSDIPGVAKKGFGLRTEKTRLGYSSPASEGMGVKLEGRLDSIVKENIAQGSFPGCQIVVVKNGNVVIDKAYGTVDSRTGSARVDRNTLYDIASMTKATATIAGLMKAYDRGLYRLDEKASRYLPRLRGTDKSDITVRQFMHHESGMPATVNTYALMVDSTSFTGKLLKYKRVAPYTVKVDKNVYGHNRARLRPDLFRTRKSHDFGIAVGKNLFGNNEMVTRMINAIYSQKPGEKKYRYSCLNFCILKDMEERLTGIGHERWVTENVFAPIGAFSCMFNPAVKGFTNIASTETDNFMRKQTLKGYVHDEIAAYSGGVQGNAGLFSNAGDIAKLCQTWLNGGSYGDVQVFDNHTVRLFTTEKSPTVDRGLGFDRATRINSLEEVEMPESVYGHTGFTGTCFWVDPENDLIVVLLCNRVNPSRDNPSFTKLNPRKEILKAVYDAMRYGD